MALQGVTHAAVALTQVGRGPDLGEGGAAGTGKREGGLQEGQLNGEGGGGRATTGTGKVCVCVRARGGGGGGRCRKIGGGGVFVGFGGGIFFLTGG